MGTNDTKPEWIEIVPWLLDIASIIILQHAVCDANESMHGCDYLFLLISISNCMVLNRSQYKLAIHNINIVANIPSCLAGVSISPKYLWSDA